MVMTLTSHQSLFEIKCSTMSFTDRLGWLFTLNKFVSIPTFSKNGQVKFYISAIRIFPILLALCQANYDIINLTFVHDITPLMISQKMSSLHGFIIDFNFICNRLGFIFLILIGLRDSTHQIHIIRSILKFEENLKLLKRSNIKSSKTTYNVNIHFVISTILIYITSLLYFVFKVVDGQLKSILSHNFYSFIVIFDNYLVLYLLAFLREYTKFVEILIGENCSYEEYYFYMSLINEILKMIPLLNSAFGGVIWGLMIKNVVLATLVLYIGLWMCIEALSTMNGIYLLIITFLYLSLYTINLTLLCNIGCNLSNKVS